MKNKKLNLNNLSVSSFITSLEKTQSETINGGDVSFFGCPGGVSISTCIRTSDAGASLCGRCTHLVCGDTYDTQNGAQTCNFTDDGVVCTFFNQSPVPYSPPNNENEKTFQG